MPSASILIKPASSDCTISCRYCFYREIAQRREAPRARRMSDDVLESLVREALEYADGHVSFAWQGGEPMLAGLGFFRRAVALQRRLNAAGIRVENAIQTNGLLVDDEWAGFFADEGFLVGLSIDGPREIHDAGRVDHGGEGTFGRVASSARTLVAHGVDVNVLSVVTAQAAGHPDEVYGFLRSEGFSYLQFIPCMSEAPGHADACAVEPEAYGHFLARVFDLWYAGYVAGADVDVRQFSNWAQMAAGLPSEECGMCGHCTTYFAVEADGSVYPCDFYMTDEWRLGSAPMGSRRCMAGSHRRRSWPGSCRCPASAGSAVGTPCVVAGASVGATPPARAHRSRATSPRWGSTTCVRAIRSSSSTASNACAGWACSCGPGSWACPCLRRNESGGRGHHGRGRLRARPCMSTNDRPAWQGGTPVAYSSSKAPV